jgi:hypothetical protein
MNWKKSLIIGLLPVLILIVFLIILITQADYNDKMPVIKHEVKRNSFNIKNHLNGLTSDNLMSTFPYKVYLDSIDIYDINTIKASILEIDTVSKDNMLSQQIVSIALTDSLLTYSRNKYENYNPDSLILLMKWMQRFNYYADIDKQNKILYEVIDEFWLNHLTNKLIQYCKDNNSLKYDYKVKYLTSQMEQNGYNTGVGFSNFEKVLNNITENKYSYIYNKFMSRSSFFQKIILGLFFLFTFYGYYCIYRIHKKN